MKTPIIIFTFFILMSTMVFATIQRSQTGGLNTVTYTTNVLTAGSYNKAYWAVDENVASCTVTGATCSGTNVECTYVGGVIRVVAYTPENGGAITQSVQVTVSGTGTCQLTNGQGVESYGTNPGSATSVSGSVTLDITTQTCNTAADTNCDGVISWNEIKSYLISWATGSTITWSNLKSSLIAWATG